MPGSVPALENTNTIKTWSLPSRSSQIGKGGKVCQSVHFGTNRNVIFLVETPSPWEPVWDNLLSDDGPHETDLSHPRQG